MRLRWFELGRVDKGASLIGLTVGSLGTIAWATSISGPNFFSQGGNGFGIPELVFFTIITILAIAPLLSGLGLILLPLRIEQRGILGFISLLGSLLAIIFLLEPLFAIVPPPLFLLAFNCTTTKAICS